VESCRNSFSLSLSLALSVVVSEGHYFLISFRKPEFDNDIDSTMTLDSDIRQCVSLHIVFKNNMQSTLVRQGPEGEPGDCLSTLRPYSDAGCAHLSLTLLGAPVNIGKTRVTVSRQVAKTENLAPPPPGLDRMWPFGIIGVATRYSPDGALGALA
jgi:hypothetical protein